jgi:hypothetical protein
MYYIVFMNKTLMASIALLVLVIGVGSNTLYHAAEAKGMPKCWLNADGTAKSHYVKYLQSTSSDTNYSMPPAKTPCKQFKTQF